MVITFTQYFYVLYFIQVNSPHAALQYVTIFRNDRLQEEQELQLPSVEDHDISFVELPVPRKPVMQNADQPLNEKVTAERTPVAFIQAGNISIALSNDISETLLGMIIREVAHA